MNSKIISRKEAADMLGVCTQSVSNYIKRGLLRQAGCARKRVCFVYLKEVEALAGKSQNIERMESSITSYEKELSEKESALKQEMEAFYAEKNIWHHYARYDFKRAILACAAIVSVSDRSIDILSGFLSGNSLEEIGKYHQLSRERVRQILCKTIRILNYRTDKYNELRKENFELKGKVRLLESECKDLLEEIKQEEGKKKPKHNLMDGFMPWEGMDLSTKLTDLDLSMRALNCLKSADIETLYELVRCKKTDLLKIRNMGKKSLTEIYEMLGMFNLSLGMPVRIVNGQYVLCIDKEGGQP